MKMYIEVFKILLVIYESPLHYLLSIYLPTSIIIIIIIKALFIQCSKTNSLKCESHFCSENKNLA